MVIKYILTFESVKNWILFQNCQIKNDLNHNDENRPVMSALIFSPSCSMLYILVAMVLGNLFLVLSRGTAMTYFCDN